ncbi:MAG TPA: hypothetical protein VF122_04840 [Caulobacteraceae bacterium]
MRAAARRPIPPADVLEYIEQMLSELAAMADDAGQHGLATGMRLLAIEAARSGTDHSAGQ